MSSRPASFPLSSLGRCAAFLALTQNLLLPRNLFFGKHCPPAAFQPAVARRLLARVTIKQVVIVSQLLVTIDFEQGDDTYSIIDMVVLAVRIARVVEDSGHA